MCFFFVLVCTNTHANTQTDFPSVPKQLNEYVTKLCEFSGFTYEQHSLSIYGWREGCCLRAQFCTGGQMVLINVRNHLVYFVCAWNLVGIWFACFDV